MPTQIPFEGPMLGAALTVAGLVISWVVWRRRGAASGLRAIAWSLLPLAAGLIGLMSILVRVVGDLVRFFANLVFNPIAWAGVAVASLAVVLWVSGTLLRRRGGGAEAKAPTADRAAPPGVGAPAPAAGKDDDLADIEALLRKHGID